MEVIAKGIWLWFYMPSKVSAMGTVVGIFQKLLIGLLQIYDDGVNGIKWKWQFLDSASVKAPLGGGQERGSSLTDRGKLGTKSIF
jgi:hypothetical protein